MMSLCGNGWGLNCSLNFNIQKPKGPIQVEPGLFFGITTFRVLQSFKTKL